MARLRVGIIGTGRKKDRPDITGFFMAYQHAAGYRALPELCELVACADIAPENARAFAEANGIPAEHIYTDYREMLSKERLDVVSICTWPHLHAPMTIDCAEAGVRAVHCEKPMADSWGAAREMARVCEERGVQLTFNHMRRFGAPFAKARGLLRDGAIGDLQRVEVSFAGDIFDTGTHYIDMCGFYAGEQPAEWVIGQVDYRQERRVFGAHAENQALGSWRYRDGVFGAVATGPGAGLIGATNRLTGARGVIEVGVPDGPLLRVWRQGSPEWEVIDTGEETLHGPGFHERGIADTIDALLHGREPELSARRALHATEIIFAIYESSRRRGRVDLPLTVSDNPLAGMVEAGEVRPASAS